MSSLTAYNADYNNRVMFIGTQLFYCFETFNIFYLVMSQ